ncbi:MAG: D-alanyl-D-alanine carboxypeptidase/D-alanyl-D-alanine-endopeptidase [Solirubrobacteraceae bacterium]|nr:D-alanyl-D-alanine carboxypeptidase/D-alanyl-D-alanine-endopeptidase [Solirubrobacteraceae bacterium]
MRLLLPVLAALAASAPIASAATGPVPGLDPAALDVMNAPPYAAAEWHISVRDLDTGEQLVALNPDLLVQPGSVVKTYSVGAAWQRFGPDHRTVTPVKRNGRVRGGRLDGDLILVGMGDITLDGRTKPDGTVDFTNLDHNDANALPGATLTPEDPLTGLRKLARRVRASGIRSVSGDVIVDDRLFETSSLPGNGPVTPIVVNNNLIDLTTTPGRVGGPARVAMRPAVAPWTVTSRVRTVAAGGDTDITVTSPRHGRIVLTGTIAADAGPVVNVYAFADPARFARTAFIQELRRAGVRVRARATARNPRRRLPSWAAVGRLPAVATLESLPLSQQATYILKVSYNRGAQTMICLLAVAAGSRDCDDGLPEAARIWRAAGLDPRGAVLVDGSGLPGNLITVDNEVRLQMIMARRPDAAQWRAALPVLGVDGSLAMVQPGGLATGRVFAKTGTLASGDLFNRRVLFPAKALGGYMDARSGRRLAFAIVVANAVFDDVEGAFAANDDVGKVATLIQQGL